MTAAIVIPTVREPQISNFLKVWKDQFRGHHVIVVEDNPEQSFDLKAANVEHYSWREIDIELGKDSWIIPRRSDCIRSFGFLKAWQSNAEFVITLDDDCLPIGDAFVSNHSEMLNTTSPSPAWTSTVEGTTPRGFPYLSTTRKLECVMNHGLWEGVPDYDAITSLFITRQPSEIKPINQVIPRGNYFPMCGMNLSFKRNLIPVMYFLLMGEDWPYDRFGDIWCGVFAKRICDHLGYAVRSGGPLIRHQRASNVWSNLRKEVPGYEVNEMLWEFVDSVVFSGKSFPDCYRELAGQLVLSGEYWHRLRNAMCVWADLFASTDTASGAHVATATA